MPIDTSPKRMIFAATSGGKRVLRTVGRLIHRSAWNINSAKFAFWAFCEVRRRFLGALTYFVPWRTYTPLRQEYVRDVTSDGAE